MKTYTIMGILLLTATAALCTGCKSAADKNARLPETAKKSAAHQPYKHVKSGISAKNSVDSLSQKKIEEKRQTIINEATAAVRATEQALAALDSNKTKEALDALAKATGNLEIVLARDPNLGLAPMDVDFMTYDVLSPLEEVKTLRKDVQKLIDEGELQEARRVIKNLRSEIVISVISIPLATYPDAIKEISPLIDQGKIEEAKIALADVLTTLVVTDHCIPLPVVRAEEKLALAETLAEKNGRNKKENNTLATLLDTARYQLQMAEALGYGSKKEYKSLYEQLATINEKTKNGQSGKGFFDSIRNSTSSMRKRIFK